MTEMNGLIIPHHDAAGLAPQCPLREAGEALIFHYSMKWLRGIIAGEFINRTRSKQRVAQHHQWNTAVPGDWWAGEMAGDCANLRAAAQESAELGRGQHIVRVRAFKRPPCWPERLKQAAVQAGARIFENMVMNDDVAHTTICIDRTVL